MELNQKVILITGASSGIGAALATALAHRGASMTLTARRVDWLEHVADQVRAAGGRALVVPGDLRHEEDILHLFEKSQTHWGRLDVLINNAGLGVAAPLHGGSSEAWRAMWEVNVLALAIATREALLRFDPEVGGHVVNISSTSAHRVPPGGGFYAATKFAVRALTEVLRQELAAVGSRTRVSSVSPGRVATDFFQNAVSDTTPANDRRAVLASNDVAALVLHILEAPPHVAIHDMIVCSQEQLT